jgi:8-oxo-dGTP diphosphatase
VPGDLNFCQQCGHRLSEKEVEGKMRPCCIECGFIVYLDPKVATAVLISMDDKLVLVKRGVEPALGHWAFPSGYVDRGEVVESAAIREAREETGLDIELDGFVGIYSQENSRVVLVVYSARGVGGSLEASYDAQEVGLFSLDELPPLPFPHDEWIINDWLALKNHPSGP